MSHSTTLQNNVDANNTFITEDRCDNTMAQYNQQDGAQNYNLQYQPEVNRQGYSSQSFYNSYCENYDQQSSSTNREYVANDARTSDLTPTAKEFTPRSHQHQSAGAIKKRQNEGPSRQYNRRNERDRVYRDGETRYPNNYRKDHRNNYERKRYSANETDTRMQKLEPLNDRKKNGSNNRLSDAFSRMSVDQETAVDEHGASGVGGHTNNHLEDKSMNYDGKRKNYQYNNFYHPESSRIRNRKFYDDRDKYTYNRNNNYRPVRDNYDKVGYRKNKYDKNKFHARNDQYKDADESSSWRFGNSSRENSSRNSAEERSKRKDDAASHKERLERMIESRTLECPVCCEKIKHNDKAWSCKQCYHIFHLSCVAAWAKTSRLENGWRCPSCQNVCSEVPKQYRCYCGKALEPKHEPSLLPHSCGDICMRKGRTCDHKCLILCHPGPCPDCNVMVDRSCECGATHQNVKCSSDVVIVCKATCSKLLDCTLHRCQMVCHPGACDPCDKFIYQECYCGKEGRKVPCNAEHKGCTAYACEDVCGKVLSCGNHKCDKLCHGGPCDLCPKDVSLIKSCHCGKGQLETPRTTCLDPVPSCKQVCGKILKCGQPHAPHSCKEICHEGECPPCPLTTLVRCRCGHMDKELPCSELTSKADDARCERKCTKKRLCGKHRCNQRCCIEVEHFCPLPCNHLLSCGQHRCDKTCHSGRCSPCMEASFEELYCECGASVLYPPIPCGTRPPLCNNPCTRPRLCGHEVNHSCHTGPCPPCTVLCKRWCYGQHEERGTIPCNQEDFSCGRPCGKPMPCGRHKCTKPCHLGACPLPCKQPCTVERPLCGHPCNAPCHDPPCPETSCKQMVPVTCPCGLQKATRPCIELIDEFRNIEMAQLKDKLAGGRDHVVDISDIICKPKKPSVLKVLECTEECRVLERNKRLAIGLQIRNPDISQKLTPRYSDFMRTWAKKDAHFCQRVHDKLADLVQLAKQSKQKSRSFSFESMNRDKRHFIHEYCEHFGCESAAYDQEPNRNVVATAFKDKSWLPSMSLLEVIQRENGHRKVPGPVMTKSALGKSESVTLKLPGRSVTNQAARPPTPPGEYVDYFDGYP